jgi:hypothetical protein
LYGIIIKAIIKDKKEVFMNKKSEIILFKTKDEKISISVHLEDETVWLTQEMIAQLFETTKQNVSLHILNIFEEGELDEKATVKDFLTVQQEGNRKVKRKLTYYNLDMIISVGYRVKSKTATQFRIWATKRINEYIRKGFTLDDERLKEGKTRYFKELLQRIRDIRSSERNLYQQVTDIYATSVDYNPDSELTREFFATVQNKMHYAAHKHTAAEIIYERVDNKKLLVGMTNFKGNYPTKDDVKIAKNFLSEKELQILNLLVSQFLDFAELQALEENPMTMKDWIKELDNHLLGNKRTVLDNKGKISHKQAMEKAEKEFDIYRKQEMKNLVSDFDKAIKKIKNKN